MKLHLLQGFGLAGAVTTVLVAQPAFAQVVQVTGVQLNSTAAGIEVILETPAGEQLQVLPRTNSNTYIADIPNAQLRLPSGNTFRRNNPVAGITSITVTNSAPNSIRVTVTGASGVPKVELFDGDEGLIFSFIPTASQANQQPQTPATPNKLNLKTRHSQRRRHLVMQHLNKPSRGGKHSQMQRHQRMSQ